MQAARLSAQLEKLHADHRELQCSLAAERRAASMAATQLQGQLEAAQRKSARLVSEGVGAPGSDNSLRPSLSAGPSPYAWVV